MLKDTLAAARMNLNKVVRGIEGAPGLVPWRGKRRSGTGVFQVAWCPRAVKSSQALRT